MDRTNISILLSTVLLGVLLYIVRQIGEQGLEAVTPPPRTQAPEAATADTMTVVASRATLESELRIIDSPAALRDLLADRDIDADAAIAGAQSWYEDRGFIGANPLFGFAADTARRDYYASLDEATLGVMSRDNDAGATQELAVRARLTDPFGALDLFELAARQGSVNALLQIASLRETLADVRPADYAQDPDYARNLRRVGGSNSERNLRYLALVSALTAMRDGGPPVTDGPLLQWVDNLADRLPPSRQKQACNQSFNDFLALSSARRTSGRPPVDVDPPPVFLGLNDLDEQLPCQDTISPIATTLDLSRCDTIDVLDGRNTLRALHVCVTN